MKSASDRRNAWVELDLDVLRQNVHRLKAALTPRTEPIFVVKANAYGHGLEPVARCAGKAGIRWFAVVHLDEALALRRVLPRAKIILLGALAPADVREAMDHQLLPMLVDRDHALSLAAARGRGRRPLACHAKIDTGMGRLGFDWRTAGRTLSDLAGRPGLRIVGAGSHLATADEPGLDFARIQYDRFSQAMAACAKGGLVIPFKHLSNSGGVQLDRRWDLDGVRTGILMYGYGKREPQDPGRAGINVPPHQRPETRELAPRPFLHWKTRVVQTKRVPEGFRVSYDSTFVAKKETWIGTLNAGYSDGYSRLLSNRGEVLINGRRRRVAGRVTMNFIVVDLGPDGDVKPGDEAVLLGSQGRESIWADELAALSQTISYEVLTRIRTDDRRLSLESVRRGDQKANG